MSRDWVLIEVVSGRGMAVKCDNCPRICRSRYEIIQNALTLEIMNVGSGCAFELTGLKHREIQPKTIVTDEVPDWML